AIGDRDAHRIAAAGDRQVNRAVGYAELAGIQDQVNQNLAQAAAITQDLGNTLPKAHAQALAALRQQRSDHGLNVGQQIGQAERLAEQAQATFANRRRAQQVLNQTLEPQRAAVHCPEHALDLLGIKLQEIFGEQF